VLATSPTITTPVLTVLASQLTLQDPTTTTKQLQFNLASLSALTTITCTVPNSPCSLASNAAPPAGQWLNSYNNGIFGWSQPQFSNLGGICGIAQGGTGANNAATSGNYLRGNGTTFASSAIQSADLPTITLTGDVTGSAIDGSIPLTYAGILPVAKGGMGYNLSTAPAPVVGDHLIAISATQFANFPLNTGTTAAANSAATASTSAVMCGYKVAFTPKYSGNVLVTVYGRFGNNTANMYGGCACYYGTGTAPNAGVAVTGSAATQSQYGANGQPASTITNFSFVAILPLTKGTAYWFDLAYFASGGGSFTIYAPVFNLIEL
jgi:hypothetical protein